MRGARARSAPRRVAAWSTSNASCVQRQNMAAAGDGDVPMSEEAADDADFTERLKLALYLFAMPEAIRKYRSATLYRAEEVRFHQAVREPGDVPRGVPALRRGPLLCAVSMTGVSRLWRRLAALSASCARSAWTR